MMTTTTTYQPKDSFLYDDWVTELLPITSPKRYLICGGRGLGKTELLEHLGKRLVEEEAPMEPKKVCHFCACRKQPLVEMDNLRSLIVSLQNLTADEGAKCALVIDNLDYLLDYLWDEYDDEKKFVDNLRTIQKVLQLFPPQGNIYLSTTTTLAQLVKRQFERDEVQRAWRDLWSIPLQQFEVQEFNPWRGSWSTRLERSIHQAFALLKDDRSTLEKEWHQAVVKVTGGHPALAGGAIKLLKELLAKFGSDKTSELSKFEQDLVVRQDSATDSATDSEKIANRIGNYLSDKLSQTKLHILLHVLQELKASEENTYWYLVAFANGQHSARDLVSQTQIRAALLYHGLVHPDENTGEYVVTGELLRQELTKDSDNAVRSLATQELDGQSGKLVYQMGSYRGELTLSGVTWLIWQLLNKEKDRVWSVTEIAQGTGLKTDTAVRSALQRLGRVLDEKNISVLENVRGKGYRVKGNF